MSLVRVILSIKEHVESALRGKYVEYETKIQFNSGPITEREIFCNYVPDVGDDGYVRGFVALYSRRL